MEMLKRSREKISADDSVLIFGDIQEGITSLPLTVSQDDLLRSAGALARLGQIFDLPTLALRIPKRGGQESRVVDEITRNRTSLTHLQRTCCDSFENDDFVRWLSKTGRGTLIVCGIATEIVVHWLVLSGLKAGFNVHVVVDACGGLGVRSEDAAFRRFETAGAILTSVHALAGELAGDFSKGPGHAAVEVVYDLIDRKEF